MKKIIPDKSCIETSKEEILYSVLMVFVISALLWIAFIAFTEPFPRNIPVIPSVESDYEEIGEISYIE